MLYGFNSSNVQTKKLSWYGCYYNSENLGGTASTTAEIVEKQELITSNPCQTVSRCLWRVQLQPGSCKTPAPYETRILLCLDEEMSTTTDKRKLSSRSI
jgi:hypothetical protein